MQNPLTHAKRIVIKIGSSLLTCEGEMRAEWLTRFCADIANMRAAHTEIILISSGAGALGRSILGVKRRESMKLEAMQAAAACGQPLLMQAWQTALTTHNIHAAQALLTLEDTQNRERYLNARNTLLHLMHAQIIPIINENDTVATDEIRYGDNDRLAAHVAAMVGADCLILLSDIDGLYDANPNHNPRAQHIADIPTLTPEILAMAGDSSSAVGTGGMRTKLLAAQIATQGGCAMIIADGRGDHPLQALQNGAPHSLFHAASTPLDARKNWIANASKIEGALSVDAGAAAALAAGKSLLPAGVTALKGHFERGAIIRVEGENAAPIAHGISNYSARDIATLKGKQTGDIAALLGYTHGDTIIHRNDMGMI